MAAPRVALTEVPHTLRMVTVGELPAFAETVAAGAFHGVPPISRVRARSLVKNPDAAPGDPAIFYTLTLPPEEKSLTYLGVMPGRLVIDGDAVAIGWLSTGYGDPAARRTSLVHSVFDGAEAAYSTLIATGASKEVAKVYRRRGYLERICHEFVHVPMARVAPQLMWERLTAAPSSGVTRPRRAVAARLEARIGRRGRLEIVPELSPATQVLRIQSSEPRGQWTEAHTAWLLANGWFPRDFAPTETESNYYFHVPGKVVSYRCLELSNDDGKPRGGAVVSLIEDGHVSVKLLEVFYDSPAAHRDVLRAALAFALAQGARSLFLSRALLRGSPLAAWLRLVARPAPQAYFFKSRDPRVLAVIPALNFATTDCDMAFW